MRPFAGGLYKRFISIKGTPHQIAIGLALGLFIGFTPTMGFQIILAVFIAALLKWNKISAAIGVQITNPITAPAIYGFTYFIGAKLMGLQKVFVWKEAFDSSKIIEMLEKMPQIFTALTIGGILIGIPVAAAGYYICFALVENYQNSLKNKLLIQKDRLKQKIQFKKKGTKKIKKGKP